MLNEQVLAEARYSVAEACVPLCQWYPAGTSSHVTGN